MVETMGCLVSDVMFLLYTVAFYHLWTRDACMGHLDAASSSRLAYQRQVSY